MQGRDPAEDLAESGELLRAAGARTVATVTGARSTPEARYFVGTGKADEIRDAVAGSAADVVVVNHELSPAQERNLERHVECRVLDRTGLILDIFAQRARTFEGQLQVELAQLRHLSTRLVRGWTHLERQKGGIGLRGPGESQLETDRRLLARRIRQLNGKLDKIRDQRAQSRRSRRRGDCFTVSLVGYTNAGKSTLFNALTGGRELTANQLFATLDTKHKRLGVEAGMPVVLSDTVGFIRRLPHELVAAFRATLEEVCEADLLLHVIDAAEPERAERVADVHDVLARIGAGEVPSIDVYNKCDLLPATGGVPAGGRDGALASVAVSARSGEGLERLSELVAEAARSDAAHYRLRVPARCGRERAWLYRSGVVLSDTVTASGDWLLEVRLDERQRRQLSGDIEVSAQNPR